MYQATKLTPSLDGWRYQIYGMNTEINCFSSEPKKVIEGKISKSLKRMNADLQKSKGNYQAFTLEGSVSGRSGKPI